MFDFILHLCETAQHAPQGIVRCTSGVGADSAWWAAQDRAVAVGSGSQPQSHTSKFSAAPSTERRCEEGFTAQGSTVSGRWCPREEDARPGQIRCFHQGVTVAGSSELSRDWRCGRETCPGFGVGQGTGTSRRNVGGTSDRGHEGVHSSRVPRNGCLLQTGEFAWHKLLCKTGWTKRRTTCASFLRQKHASNASRRRRCRLARLRLVLVWNPAELQQLREKVNESQNLNTELQGSCKLQAVGVTLEPSGTPFEGGFLSLLPTKTSCGGCRIVRPTCKRPP